MGHSCRVNRPGPTKAHHRVAAGVTRLFNYMNFGRRGHILVDQPVNTRGSFNHAQAQRLSYPGHGCFGCLQVKLHLTAQKIGGVEIAQYQVRIGNGGAVTAKAIAGRAGIGSGAFRANF